MHPKWTDWIFTKEHESNPHKAVVDLLAWQQVLALDPAISEPAAKLHARIAELEAAASSERERLKVLPRYGIHLREHHKQGELINASFVEEQHPEGGWVKWSDVAALLAEGEKS